MSKILVIDDEPSVLESFKMILKIKDYDVLTFPDGASAIAQLKKGEIDLAFVDYKIPGMDGLEVLKRIKEIDPTVEVILSGWRYMHPCAFSIQQVSLFWQLLIA